MAHLTTTTIGSLFRFSENLHESIEKAIEFQREHGIDIFSDGEQRTDMISYFAESFTGLAVENGQPMITGRIAMKGRPDDFSKIKDLDYILSEHPDLKIKVAITGPTTLGMTCGSRKIRAHYRNITDFKIYEDIAEALKPIAKAVVDRGAFLQLDEPFLSQGYRDLAQRVKLLDDVAEGLNRDKVSVHVCGFVGGFGVVRQLVGLDNVSVLSFGFSGRIERPNIEHISRTHFEDNGKKVGAGCIAVTPMNEAQVDDPSSVQGHLRDVSEKVGRENIAYAHPDCGMRATNKSLVSPILENMRAGVDLFG
jgi:methionine synthase II (cobalamin-independent)